MEPIVIVVIAQKADLPRADARIDQLRHSGFEGRICVGPIALRETLQAFTGGKVGDELAALVLLDGSLRDNCAAAQLVTTLYPQCGVLSLLDKFDEASLITVLQSGADLCYPTDISTALLSSVLYSLLRRSAGSGGRPDAKPFASLSESWQLAEKACSLEGPHGVLLPLTTSERAFLMCLTEQPDMRASHAELILAVDPQEGGGIPLRVAQSRLGVLVSRLRRKLQLRYGQELPVKSVHKWGYMFTGELRT